MDAKLALLDTAVKRHAGSFITKVILAQPLAPSSSMQEPEWCWAALTMSCNATGCPVHPFYFDSEAVLRRHEAKGGRV